MPRTYIFVILVSIIFFLALYPKCAKTNEPDHKQTESQTHDPHLLTRRCSICRQSVRDVCGFTHIRTWPNIVSRRVEREMYLDSDAQNVQVDTSPKIRQRLIPWEDAPKGVSTRRGVTFWRSPKLGYGNVSKLS